MAGHHRGEKRPSGDHRTPDIHEEEKKATTAIKKKMNRLGNLGPKDTIPLATGENGAGPARLHDSKGVHAAQSRTRAMAGKRIGTSRAK